ncbi:MAG TPA: UbiA prenyltransferase family protein [Cyclobacteriaceae bacterium]|nr:UbiA prenyltransferase family protein [Cyclobacteriaceae bacterium]
MTAKNLVELLRIKQWVKNLFLAIPAFFAGTILDYDTIRALVPGILAFSLVASGIYIINDYRDRHTDRLHPLKKNRPLASGVIKNFHALLLAGFLIISGLLIGLFLNQTFFWFILIYLLINIGYSLGLKNVTIVDLLLVSLGFLIRIYAGGVLAEVVISHWLAIMVFLLALFLVVAKRKDDLIIYETTGERVRKVSTSYNSDFINSCITLLSAVILVAYLMYTLSVEVIERLGNEYIFATTFFVIAGLMRYLQIIFVERKSGSPTQIFFTDKFIVLTILGWIISFYFLIYH